MKRQSLAFLGLALTALGMATVAIVAPSTATQAANGPTFVIPINDGYGIGECVATGAPCTKVVADSWCEAQGFRRSASVGPADVETTGSIDKAPRRISITCAQ